MPGRREVREDHLDLVGGEGRAEPGPGQLVGVVASQVPRHRLEPRDGVDGGPLLDLVARHLEAQHGILQRHVARVAHGGDVVVDTVRVGVEVLPRLRRQGRQLLLGDVAPTKGADDLVGLDPRRADELGEPAGRDVAAEVHLEEAVLRGDEALGPEEVVRGVGIDLGHTLLVPDHPDLGAETVELDLARDLWPRLTHDPRPGDDEHADDEDDEDEDTQPHPSDHPGALHPARLGHGTRSEAQDHPGLAIGDAIATHRGADPGRPPEP